jgi:hypothetical protein
VTDKTHSVISPHLRLDYLTSAGPRITGLYLPSDETNIFADLPGVGWDTPYGKYLVIGGHRLWHAPEIKQRTYIPDTAPVLIEKTPGSVRLIQQKEASTGITKSIHVRMDADKPAAIITHNLRNDNLWDVTLAPWAITQMCLGGTSIHPQRTDSSDPDRLLPNRILVLWSYASWMDERLALGDELILLEGRPALPPFKLGYANYDGWEAYLYQDLLFVKTFPPFDPARSYVDFGCNAESYVNDQFIEVESLGPLSCLEPGQSIDYIETWYLTRLAASTHSIVAVRERINELIRS